MTPRTEPHPMQPIIAKDGVYRFKKNLIVEYLLDMGPFDLNELTSKGFSNEDFEQFAQLIGYSVYGWCDLSYVSEESKDKAEELIRSL